MLEALGVSPEDVRRWAKSNLPPLTTFHPEQSRSLRFEYQVTVEGDSCGVRLVQRPINLPCRDALARPRGFRFIPEPEEWNDLHREASDLLIGHMDEATARLGEEPSTDEVVRAILLHILEYADVLECVAELGQTPERWRLILDRARC